MSLHGSIAGGIIPGPPGSDASVTGQAPIDVTDGVVSVGAASGVAAGSQSAASFTKLAGIETGAQVTSSARVLTALAAAGADIAVDGQKITGLASGSATNHAATVGQAYAIVAEHDTTLTWLLDVAPGAIRDFDARYGLSPSPWVDQAGTGNAINATSAKRPTVAYGPSGRLAAYFEGAGNYFLADDDTSTNAEYTIFVVFSPDATQTAVYAAWFSNRPWGPPLLSGTKTLLGLRPDLRPVAYQDQVTPAPEFYAAYDAPIALGGTYLLTLRVEGARRYLYLDGVLIAADLMDQADLTTEDAVFFGGEDGGSQAGGYIHRILTYGISLGPAPLRKTHHALMAYHGIVPPDVLIYADGDSRTQAISPGLSTLIAHTVDRLDELEAPARRIVNVALSGQQVSTMATNAPYQIAPGFLPGATHNIAIINGAHNSLKNVALSDTDVETEIATEVAVLRNAGFRVLVCTTPISPALVASTVKVEAVNAWTISTYGDDAIDLAGIVGLTYADGDHEDDDGYALEGIVLGDVIAAIIS
jgi:hypothetical protein